MNIQDAKALRKAPLSTPTDLKPKGVRAIAGALNVLLADMFALYLKTKNFTGTFRDRTSATIT
jgi:starvation-inducible DNA-binding protein